MMRISTGMVFDLGVGAMQRQNYDLLKVQQQIANNRRIVTPADDPVGAARALEVQQSKDVVDQYSVNQKAATSALQELDAQLSSVTDALQEARATAVNAANGALTNSDRNSLAQHLRASYDQLLSLANAKDGAGNYMFSGYKTDTKPYTAVIGGAVTYNGDEGVRQLQTAPSRNTTTSAAGPDAFEGMFETLGALVTALETPIVGSGNAAAVSAVTTALEGMDSSLNRVMTVRSMAGSQLNELTALSNLTTSLSNDYAGTLSSIQDLDLASAISQLSQHQLNLQAAQQSFSRISNLSLFNVLS